MKWPQPWDTSPGALFFQVKGVGEQIAERRSLLTQILLMSSHSPHPTPTRPLVLHVLDLPVVLREQLPLHQHLPL